MTTLSKNLVVVAMSGGVDSSVAALLLKEQGMEVVGVSMKVHEGEEPEGAKTCCSASDIQDARSVCQQLDIPFYPMNFKEDFSLKVVQYFAREYSQGRTPNPCVQCNEQIKFAALLKEAKGMGAYHLATGHYAQKTRDRNGRYHLLKGRDRNKDQSYFLFSLGQGELEHSLFPIGKYTKEEVREFARGAGLKTAEKEESQEICFVPDNDYAGFIEKELPQYQAPRGAFVDTSGKVLGEHHGVHAYTVGQRRGVGLPTGERVYVAEIDAGKKQVVLGDKESLLMQGLIARGVKWVNRDLVTGGQEVEVKLRSRHKGVMAALWLTDETTVRIDFRGPEGPVTPGQAAVFYLGDEVLGGGWIEKGLK